MNRKEIRSCIIYTLVSLIILSAGIGLWIRCINKSGGVKEIKRSNKEVILKKRVDPVKVEDKDNYPLYNRTLDTVPIGNNIYQVNAIYIGNTGISVVKISTFKK